MSLTIRYFASVREKLGSQESVELSELASPTVGALQACLASRSPLHAAALAEDRCLRTACNQAMCDDEQVLADGDEVAFFPPVTGG